MQKEDKIVRGSDIKVIGAQIKDKLGSGIDSITTDEDGSFVIVLKSGDTITVDINHEHAQYLKYALMEDEAAYEALATKDPGTLYLIPESE